VPTFLPVGIRKALGLTRAADQLQTELARANVYLLESGTAYGDVAAAGALAAFGADADTDHVDRTTAMTVPAMRRARQVVCGTIGALPLLAHRTDADGTVTDVTADRPVLTQPNPNVSRSYFLTWVIDDLFFHGVSWLRVIDRDPQGYPRQVERLRPDRVLVDLERQRVAVDGQLANDRDIVRIDGPDEGVLTYGGRTLRTCIRLEQAVRRFARLDVPLGTLKLAEGAAELSPDEVDELLDAWEAARASRTTAFLNRAVDYAPSQFDAEKVQLAEARQYQAAEVARLANLSPRYVNAPNASGMTYANVSDERRDLVDTSLGGYLVAVQDRLSMGDFTPRGTVVRWDLSGLLRGDLLTALQAAQLAVDLGAMTKDEVRTDVLQRPPLRTSEGNPA
jgi:phage portal protein BeeE